MKVRTSDGLELPLSRHPPRSARSRPAAVLLLHGASASSATFEVPIWGEPPARGFVDYLCGLGFEVWALDWRGGHLVGRCRVPDAPLTLDRAAEVDLPETLAVMRSHLPREVPIVAVAHCMGAAALAMAIGAGRITAEDLPAVVLSSIGLFYDVRWDGWVKAEDQALERVLIEAPATEFVHCNAKDFPWPESLEQAFEVWPKRLLPAPDGAHPFTRLTFMFGRPWLEGPVALEDQTAEVLFARFGAMPMELYIQCGQNVRRGFAAPYNDTSWGASAGEPRPRSGLPDRALDPKGAGKYLNHAAFRGMRVTLITGELNMLWHPDSIRRMYEWLRRDRAVRVEKYVLRGYGHQDLFWARSAPRDVYPLILRGLEA